MPTIIEQLHQMPWTAAFSNRALDKALRYAKENRVKIIDLDVLTVSATCKGSEGNVYEQFIELIEYDDGVFVLDCSCSCPVVIDCKHCATVIYHLQDLPVESSESSAQVRLNRDLERWLNDIPHEISDRDGAAQSTGTCWVYKLKATPTAGKWLLEICKARQLKG